MSQLIISMLLTCILVHSSASQEFRKGLKCGQDTVFVVISATSFRAQSHRIGYSKDQYIRSNTDTIATVETIDGHEVYGTDGELPHNQVSKFRVVWNEQPISIPNKLYIDCYEPNFDGENGFIKVVSSPERAEILIQMQGSDGGGAYEVWWIIPKKGEPSRFISVAE